MFSQEQMNQCLGQTMELCNLVKDGIKAYNVVERAFVNDIAASSFGLLNVIIGSDLVIGGTDMRTICQILSSTLSPHDRTTYNAAVLECLSHKISFTITVLFKSTLFKEIVFFKIFHLILYYVKKVLWLQNYEICN